MENQPIAEEKTRYGVLLYRKNRTMRMLETILFVLGLAFLFWQYEFRSPAFIVGTIITALAAMLVTPALYLVIAEPRYKLYHDKLEIQIGKKTETVFLTEVVKDFDLPYFFLIQGKRTPLLVSNHFLDELNLRLEVIKRGWESK